MTDTVEHVTINKSPLEEKHRALGAVIGERDGWEVPFAYAEVAAEYESVRGGDVASGAGRAAGLIDLSPRGRLTVSGTEAVQFLNGLITNDVAGLGEGAWMRAAFPNAQGRLLASVRVLNQGGGVFLLDTEAVTRERVLNTLERFTLAGDFRVADKTLETALVSIQGAHAAAIIDQVLGREAARVERGRVWSGPWEDSQITMIRATHTGEDGFDLFISREGAARAWDALADAGGRAVGFAALEVLRVEAGLPRYGIDMDESNVVLEAGLDDAAVSFTKGCYIGQEIIARIHWRGHVAKKLTGLIYDDDAEPAPAPGETRVRTVDGKEIGRVTSAVLSPRLGRRVALAYIKYDFLRAGTEVLIVGDDKERAARVAELPHVRGSWFDAAASGAPEELTV